MLTHFDLIVDEPIDDALVLGRLFADPLSLHNCIGRVVRARVRSILLHQFVHPGNL